MRSIKKIITTVFVGALVLIASRSLTNSSGPGGGYTNAPGEQNCTRCHTGTLITSGSNLNNLKLTGNFTGNGYIPDSTYDLTVSYSQSSKSKWGFQITILDSNNKKVGTLTSKGTRNRKRTATISGAQREYIEQTSTGTASTGTNKTDWTFEWKAPSSNVGKLTAYVVVNAANGSGTGGDQIYAKKFTIAPSTLLPVAGVKASDTLVCGGSTIKFTGTGTNSPTSYDWTLIGASPNSSTKQNPEVVYNTKGKYKASLVVTNSKGKSQKVTVNIEVLESPNSLINGSAVREICKGGSVELIAGFNPKYKYKWSNGKTGNKITVSDTGSYYVTTTLNTCSKISNLVQVKYFKDTKVSLTSDAVNNEACLNNKINFTATKGFDSVKIYKNFNLVQTIDTHEFSQVMSDTASYNVKVIDGNGCLSPFSDTVKINVQKPLEPPVVKCDGVTTTTASFSWVFNGHPNGYQISLDTGKTWTIASTGPTGLKHVAKGLIPDKNYTLMVRAIGDAPCVLGSPGSTICKTGSCNTLTLSHKYDTAVCLGDSVKVVINGLKGQRYSLSFENGPAFHDTSFYFSPDFPKIYRVFVTDSNAAGCPAEELEMDVNVHRIADVRLRTQSSNNQFCITDTIKFRATDGNDKYRFYVNNQLKTTTTDSFYFEKQYNNGDSAWVIAEKGLCVAQSEKIGILVFPESDAGFTYSYASGKVEFKPNVDSYSDYFWNFGDGNISVVRDASQKYAKSFEGDSVDVKLTITDNNGCENDTTLKVFIPFFSSIGEVDINSNLEIYPNPAKDLLNIRLRNGSLNDCKISIYSIKGDLKLEEYPTQNEIKISLHDLESGVYWVEILDQKGSKYRRKLMLQ